MLTAIVWVLAPTAQAATSTFFFLNAGPVQVGTSPYKMSYTVSKGGSQASLTISLTRVATTGNHPSETHSYSFGLPGSDFTCTSTFSSCTLNTGTNLGPASAGKTRNYGKIDQTFKPTAAAKTTKTKCKNGTVTGSVTTRAGNMTGLFNLITFNSFFGTLTNAGNGKIPDRIPATVTKIFSNGKVCPPGPSTCFGSISLTAFDFSGGVNIIASKALNGTGKAVIVFGFTEPASSTAPAGISHSIFLVAPLSAFTAKAKTLATATINGNAGSPFLTGSTTFTAQQPPQTFGTTCKTTSRQGQVSGNLAAHFDGLAVKPLGNQSASLSKTFKA